MHVDSNSLDGKTNVDIILNVGAITGNITEITKVFTSTGEFVAPDLGAAAATISGTVKASEADAIADKTSGTVTATIAAGNANVLNTALDDSVSQVNAYKITVSGDNANATDLLGLDSKTSIAVDASEIGRAHV